MNHTCLHCGKPIQGAGHVQHDDCGPPTYTLTTFVYGRDEMRREPCKGDACRRFCNVTCTLKWERARHIGGKDGPTIDCPCWHCGEEAKAGAIRQPVKQGRML